MLLPLDLPTPTDAGCALCCQHCQLLLAAFAAAAATVVALSPTCACIGFISSSYLRVVFGAHTANNLHRYFSVMCLLLSLVWRGTLSF